MAVPDSCNVLRKSDSGELIVVADYAATGRPAASFHDLVELARADHTIWETAPVPYGRERGMTGQDQADRWLRDIKASGMPVRALLGFCGGGIYVAVMAEHIAQWQEPPTLILFDPGFADRHMLVEHIEGMLRRLALTFSAEQLAEARNAVRAADISSGDPLALAENLGVLCHQILTPAMVRAGYSERASSDGSDLIVGYLHWLAGAAQLDPRAQWARATAFNSETSGAGLHALTQAERAHLVANVTYFDVPHADLLRNAEVAAAIDELLN